MLFVDKSIRKYPTWNNLYTPQSGQTSNARKCLKTACMNWHLAVCQSSVVMVVMQADSQCGHRAECRLCVKPRWETLSFAGDRLVARFFPFLACKVSQISRVLKAKFDKNLSSQKIQNLIRKLSPTTHNDDASCLQNLYRESRNTTLAPFVLCSPRIHQRYYKSTHTSISKSTPFLFKYQKKMLTSQMQTCLHSMDARQKP